jgi:hypothetical protein
MGIGAIALFTGPVLVRTAPDEHWSDPLVLVVMTVGGALIATGILLHFWVPRMARGRVNPRLLLKAIARRSPFVWRGFSGDRTARKGWVKPLAGLRKAEELPPSSESDEPTPSWEELNRVRVARYEETRGLFLVHEWWTPSQEPGQVADVTIRLFQHGEGPLSRDAIRAVEYTLGPRFTDHSLVRSDPTNGYAIHVPMWGPMLCLAKIYFTDGSRPLLLERYINFERDPNEPSRAAPLDIDGPTSADPAKHLSPERLGEYLAEINQTMEAYGFGRNPNQQFEDPTIRRTIDRLSIERDADNADRERTRRALIKDGYALLARLEDGSIKSLGDVAALARDLRVWARAARGFVRAELPHRQNDLPDDEPLNASGRAGQIELVNAYLDLIRT